MDKETLNKLKADYDFEVSLYVDKGGEIITFEQWLSYKGIKL